MVITYLFAKHIACFKHWLGTQFSVFASIGRVVRIGVLPLAYVMLSFGQHAFAQADSVIRTYHEEIDSVLIETVRQQALSLIPRASVQRLTGEQLLKTGSTSVQQALDVLPGVDIRQRGPLGIQADLGIRGGSFDQVLILIDGLDVTDAQTGHHSLALPLRPEAMSRLELLSGPGARMYGPGAYAGAINIIPRRADSTHFLLSTKFGQYGLKDMFAGLAHRYGNISFTGYATGSSSDGYTTNTDHVAYTGYIATQLDLPRGQIRIQLAHLGKAFGAQAYYTPKFPDQFETVKTSIATLSYQGYRGRWEWETNFAYRHLTDCFELFRNNAPAWYKGHNYHQTQLATGRARMAYSTHVSRTQLALIGRYDDIWSTNLGKTADKSRAILGVAGQRYTHCGDRLNLTASLEQTLYISALTINLGAMSSYNSAYKWTYAYGADLSYRFSPIVNTTLSINSAYRLPTFTDLYYNSPTRAGNENLRPENALTTEGGVNLRTELFRASLTGFYRIGRNIIDWIQPTPSATVWQAQNHKSLNTIGGELSAGIYPRVQFLENVEMAYAYCKHLNTDDAQRGSSYALDNLVHLLTLRAEIPCTKWVSILPAVRYSKRAGFYTPIATGIATSYPDNLSLDLRTIVHLPAVELFVEASNLLDAKRVDIGEVPLPGRWLSCGATYRLNW